MGPGWELTHNHWISNRLKGFKEMCGRLDFVYIDFMASYSLTHQCKVGSIHWENKEAIANLQESVRKSHLFS